MGSSAPEEKPASFEQPWISPGAFQRRIVQLRPVIKQMHLGKSDVDVTLIPSCVKGVKARAVRNAFTDSLAAGGHFPPRSKAWFFREGDPPRTCTSPHKRASHA
jgi:hypothetical protein